MVFIGRHFLPIRRAPGPETQIKGQLRIYISEVRVLPDGILAGRTLLESKLGADYELTVIALVRGKQTIKPVERYTIIEADDILLSKAQPKTCCVPGMIWDW